MWVVLFDNTIEVISNNMYGRFLYSSVSACILSFIYLYRRAGVKAGQVETTAIRMSLGKGYSKVFEVNYLVFSLVIIVGLYFLGWKVEVSGKNQLIKDRGSLIAEIAKYESEPCISGVPKKTFWDAEYIEGKDRLIEFFDGSYFKVDNIGSNLLCHSQRYFSLILSEEIQTKFSRDEVGRIKICALKNFSSIGSNSKNDKCIYKVEAFLNQ